MIKAVLLDMDNTVLKNPDRAFATAFLTKFEQHFETNLAVQGSALVFRRLISLFSRGRIGDESNSELTVRTMAETTGQSPEKIRTTLNQFYDEIYPFLQSCIQPVAGVVKLIEELRDAGHKVIIATNPIYPASAVKQRLMWANLPAQDADYDFITSADNMHYAKPDPAYFAEILGRIGVEPDETIMVGDSFRNDIRPAQTIGIHTYHLKEHTLADFMVDFPAIKRQVARQQLQPSMIEPQLRGNIGALYGLLADVQPNFWHQKPVSNEWSIVQILCHLVSAENHNERPRLQKILRVDNPFITAPKPPGPNIEACAEEGLSVARHFVNTRQKTIELIQTFTDDDWKKPARHSIFGLTTMLEMAYFTAQHDRLHLNQLCETIGRCE